MTSTERLLAEILATLQRMEALAKISAAADGLDVDICPKCNGMDLIDASVMGSERTLCRDCGAVTKKEPVNG